MDAEPVAISLLAIMNPLGQIPLFISVTAAENSIQLSKTINLVTFAMLPGKTNPVRQGMRQTARFATEPVAAS